jgi:type II secretory pathway component PulF
VASFSLLVLGGCTGLFLPRVFIGAGPIIILLFFISITVMVRRVRLHRAYVILAYIEQAARLNLPLATLLTSAARSERGVLAERLALLGQSLQNGLTVASALAGAVPEVPAEVIADIESGEAVGRLPQTLRRIMVQRRRTFLISNDEAVFSLFYPLLMLILVSGILSFFLTVIVAKFQEIFRDFHTTLPRATALLIDFADSFYWFGSLLGFLMFIVLLMLIAGMLRRIFIARDFPALTRPALDWLRWHVPLYGPIEREAELARVCTFLGEALQQDIPFVSALDTAEHIPQNAAMRGQITHWRSTLMQGASISQAARAAGFPRTMIDLLGPAERTSSVPEAFAFLARHFRWRTDRRRIFLVAALQPVMVIAVGCVVGFITFALFSPLVSLIDATSALSGSL